MNDAQSRLMRWLDSEWAKHQRAAGKPDDREARLAFYQKVIGRRVTSSSQLRNNDVTEIKRRILALAQPANFKAQMKSQVDNDPAAIKRRYNERIDAALYVLKPDSDYKEPRWADDNRADYARSQAQRMFKKAWHELTEDELRKLAGLFEERAASRQARDQAAALRYAEEAGEASDRVPF